MLPALVLLGFVPCGLSGLHARQAGDVRARVPAIVLPVLGNAFPLGAPGVHARLVGDVRAGPRLLQPLRLGFVSSGLSGLHARLAGDVRARVPAVVVSALGRVPSLGAPGVHARLVGDVRAGPRLLPLPCMSLNFDITASAAPSAVDLASVPPLRSLSAVCSSLVLPPMIAIAIGCRGYRAVGAPPYYRTVRNVSVTNCVAMMFLQIESSSNRG
jgi:hypothetical protein